MSKESVSGQRPCKAACLRMRFFILNKQHITVDNSYILLYTV